MEQKDCFPVLAISCWEKLHAEEVKNKMGTEQQADGLGPPWVKGGGGIGKGMCNTQRMEPQETPVAVLNFPVPNLRV